MRGSIRTRLIAGTGIGVALAFAIAGWLVHLLAARAFAQQFDATLVENARSLALLVEDDDGLESDIPTDGLPGDYYELWDGAGETVVRSMSLGQNHLGSRAGAGPVRLDDVTLPGGTRVRRAMMSFAPRTEAAPERTTVRPQATLAYARSRAGIDATLGSLDRVLVGVGAGATLLALLLAFAVSRFALRPVRALADNIAALDATRLDTRVAADDAPAELRVVASRLDDLLQRLSAAFTRERQLTGEVAHELRTPLAGLRATIEVALSRERTPERYQTTLQQCLAICISTERVVETLLSLARLDAGQLEARMQTVELDVLVRELTASFEARATERQLAVTVEAPPVRLTTDPDLLRIVLTNLLDNAVSYADRGGSVRVTVGSAITISNTGCTLTAEQVAQVFQRFWRGDEARSAGRHAGLGLALAKQIVDLLDGQIDATVDDGRFVATVRL